MAVVEKVVKVFMEELKESSVVICFLSKQSIIALVCQFSGSSNCEDQWKVRYSLSPWLRKAL